MVFMVFIVYDSLIEAIPIFLRVYYIYLEEAPFSIISLPLI